MCTPKLYFDFSKSTHGKYPALPLLKEKWLTKIRNIVVDEERGMILVFDLPFHATVNGFFDASIRRVYSRAALINGVVRFLETLCLSQEAHYFQTSFSV